MKRLSLLLALVLFLAVGCGVKSRPSPSGEEGAPSSRLEQALPWAHA